MRNVFVILLVVSCQLSVVSSLKKPETGNRKLVQESVADAIKEGITLYRTRKFKQALEKFEAAIRQDPKNDEALLYAAVTAFRLGNQIQSRGYFLQRAELPGQKDTVKAFCYFRVALTYWREAHDIVAKYGNITGERLANNIPEREAADADRIIKNGLEYVDRALAITRNFAAAYNIKNLLHAEAALAAKDVKKAKEQQNEAILALRQSVEKTNKAAAGTGDAVDFNQPTVRVAEFAVNVEDDRKIDDPMLKTIAGGKPRRRVKANFPSVRPAESGAPTSGQEQTAVAAPDFIKVEVLVSTTGSVLFTRVIDGQQGLNDAAILAAQGWRFDPATFEGKPVQLSSVISFEVKKK
jgi:hypothetical protein